MSFTWELASAIVLRLQVCNVRSARFRRKLQTYRRETRSARNMVVGYEALILNTDNTASLINKTKQIWESNYIAVLRSLISVRVSDSFNILEY